MKKAEMMDRILAGDGMIPGRYVLCKKEVVLYTVKKGPEKGQRAHFNKLSYAIMNPRHGIVFVDVDTRKIEGFEMDKFKSPFKEGQEVVAEITDKMTTDRGIKTVSGVLHPIEP